MESPSPSEGLPFFGNYTPHFPPPPSAEPALAALETGELVPVVIIYTIIVFVGIVGNSGLLVALMSAHGARVRTPLLVSVCVADLLVCACSGPLAVMRASELGGPANSTPAAPFFTGEERPCDTLPCMLLIAAETLPVSASTLSLMMLSVDRYITVQHPRCLSQLQRCPAVVALLVWAVAALLTTPTMVDLGPNPALQVARVILAYLLPSIAVFACHMGVRSKLCALSLTARAAHGELPLPVPLMRRPTHVIIVAGMANAAQTQAVTYGYEEEEDERAERRKRRSRPSGGPVRGGELRRQRDPRTPAEPSLLAPQPQTSTLQSRRRLANVLVTVAAVFAVCWLPHFVCCLHALLAGGALPVVQYRLLRLTLMLGHAHSAINPAVYWTLNHQTLSRGGCMPCPKPAAARRFLFHLKLQDEQPPSSTNEAALGPFHPRYTRSRPRIERCAPSSHYLY